MSFSKEEIKKQILDGEAVLGIEFGSTRIKAVLVDKAGNPIAGGAHDWENRLENGIWTYTMEDVWTGLADCYQDMTKDVQNQYGVEITKLAALGFSAMMHGYLVFDEQDKLLTPFRTWRNTITGQASEELTKLFNYHIPQRWSIAHLYQAILNGEEHVPQIRHITTLAGYVHWQLTGEKVLGVGEASGMFPIDLATGDFDAGMIAKFEDQIKAKNFPWKLKEILPKVVNAGTPAGTLTAEGAKKLDPSGKLQAGIPLCPPEGDAGTGMVATNSVAQRTGNVSAGTSIFGMVVLEKELSKVYDEIDLVTTPDGSLVAMVHCNNCTSDINAWVNLMAEYTEAMGYPVDKNKMYVTLFNKALEADADCGGVLSYNYFSGEHVTGFNEGRPLMVRKPDAHFNLPNFMRANLHAALAVLKNGMDLLLKEENVQLDEIFGHGGFFKTEGVGQRLLAGALNAPVSVMETAGEGGAWGMAVLASYLIKGNGKTLPEYLNTEIFSDQASSKKTLKPVQSDVDGFNKYMEGYTAGLAIERAAVDSF
ncbi:MAG: FGGY-family carbohydrate kinase [Lachnospiraceae bacterium]|nr:FGGY-family carbohydrate kinase [Lachnospiraceae bacterium]